MEVYPRKLPSFPSNYVTLVQLQERWVENQKRTQNTGEQLQPETKPQEPRPNGNVLQKSGLVLCLSRRQTTDEKIETEELKTSKGGDRLKKWMDGKREDRTQAATAAAGAAEDEVGEANEPPTEEASVRSRSGGRLGNMSVDGEREKEKEGQEAKSEGAVCLVSSKFTDKKTWTPKKYQGKGEWKKVKEMKRDDEQVTTGETQAPKTSGEEEEKSKSGNAIVADQAVEIEGRLKDMSIKGGGERGNDKLTRPYKGGSYRGGYRSFDKGSRRREMNPRNAGMIWVKKGDTSGGNADDVQSPGCL